MMYLPILAQVAEPSWEVLVRNFGVPGAMMAVALFALMKGWIITKREGDQREQENLETIKLLREQQAERETSCKDKVALIKEQRDNDIKWWQERHLELKQEATTRLEILRTEKDMWRETALKATHIATTATDHAVKQGGAGAGAGGSA